MIKKIFCSTFLIFICLKTYAQEARLPNQSYFFLGLGVPIFKVKDAAHSPLTYKGWSIKARLGYEQYRVNYLSRQSISFTFGSGGPKPQSKSTQMLSHMDLTSFEFNFQYYHRSEAFDTEGLNRYYGGGLSFYFDVRNYNLPSNNLLGYQANVSLNAGGFVHKKMKDNWHFEYELFTPVISYALRTNYNGMLPSKGNDFRVSNILKSGKIVTFNKNFRLYSQFAFNQRIKDYRQRRLTYTWDYHLNKLSQPLSSVTAGISYEALFKM